MVHLQQQHARARIPNSDVIMYALYHTVHTIDYITSHRDLGVPYSADSERKGRGFTEWLIVSGLSDHLPGQSPFGRDIMDVGIETDRRLFVFPTASSSQILDQLGGEISRTFSRSSQKIMRMPPKPVRGVPPGRRHSRYVRLWDSLVTGGHTLS